MHAHRDNRRRSTVAVIARVVHPLVIEGQVSLCEERNLIVGLHDILRAWMRRLAVAHQNSQAARVQIALTGSGDAVVDERKTDCVARTTPVTTQPKPSGR